MNKLIIFIIIITIIVIYMIHNKYKHFKPTYNENDILNISKINNKNRHVPLSDENNNYAKFSKITSRLPSFFKYPKYYSSHPKEYIVNKGEYLYIPKNWWHWIVSFRDDDDYSFSCNFWFEKEINNSTPYISKYIDNNINDDILKKFQKEIDTNNTELSLWCDNDTKDNKTTLKDFITNKEKYKKCYLLTLPAYEVIKNNKNNTTFFEDFKKNIPTPDVIKDNNIEKLNFWVNNGNVDSGLHYDKSEGIMCVLNGRKIVTLFPPSDSQYLYPYE